MDIFRLRRSDMIAIAIVIWKPCGFSDILFASKTREAKFRLWRNIHSAKAEYHCEAIELAKGE